MLKDDELLHAFLQFFLHIGAKNWGVAIVWRKTAGIKKPVNAGKYKSPLCSGLAAGVQGLEPQ